MAAAITSLFSILANWPQDGVNLTLELNAYSPSDTEHWFKKCYFGAPGENELESLETNNRPQNTAIATAIHDPSHGWWHGQVIEEPNQR